MMKISHLIFSLSLSMQCYKRILQLDPVNIQGLHNLCVVYVERGLLMKAHACLQEAHALAPHEDYIIKHLQIIETRLTRLKSQSSSGTTSTEASRREQELAFAEFDPSEFGGRASAVKSAGSANPSSDTIKMSQFHTSSASAAAAVKSNTVEKLEQPQFHDTVAYHASGDADDYHGRQESLKQRIQNNFATDLDDPSSGMS